MSHGKVRSLLSGISLLPTRWPRRIYTDTAATGVGRVADQAENMKSAKYADFTAN